MPRAIFKNGRVELIDPVPLWREGQMLDIEPLDQNEDNNFERDFHLLNELCRTDGADDRRLEQAMETVRRDGKDWVRERMELP